MFTHISLSDALCHLVKGFGLTASLAVIGFMSVGCSDNEDAPSDDPADYSVAVSMSYLLEGDESQLGAVEIYTVGEKDDPLPIKQPVNSGWTHEMELPGLPEAFGFMAAPAIRDNISAGTMVDLRSTVRMVIELKCKGQIIDTRIVDETDESGAIDPSKAEWADMVDSYVFHIVDGKIVRLQDTGSNDEEETPSEDMPSVDSDNVKVHGTLYYISEADVAETPD